MILRDNWWSGWNSYKNVVRFYHCCCINWKICQVWIFEFDFIFYLCIYFTYYMGIDLSLHCRHWCRVLLNLTWYYIGFSNEAVLTVKISELLSEELLNVFFITEYTKLIYIFICKLFIVKFNMFMGNLCYILQKIFI